MVEPAGVYLHIPFCIRKCPYCDFYSITDFSLKKAFINSIQKEIKSSPFVDLCFDTIYIGGGTPSTLDAKDLGSLVETAYSGFKFIDDTEITVEINPGTISLKVLKEYRKSGVNRLSIGVQSFNESNLGFLGRIHSAKDGSFAVDSAKKAGFEKIGIDLIYGIPNQTKKSWLLDLKQAVSAIPEHISCYMLTFEQGTKMEKDRKKGCFKPMTEKLIGDLFEATIDFLTSQGYEHYEVSNFARKHGKDPSSFQCSFQSRHNRKYWSFTPYLGFGPSAHSFVDPERWWNYPGVKKYIDKIEAGKSPVCGKEKLSRQQKIIEMIYLGLRTTRGICIDTFDKKFNTDFKKIFKELISDLEAKGSIKVSRNRCFLTPKGMLFLDSIASLFIAVDIK
jgi:oxygen-independent coproporphyrinogen-3 oxidase